MRRPPAPPLLDHPLRPETTPSGTAVAISQSPFFSPLFSIKQNFPAIVLCNMRDQTASLDVKCVSYLKIPWKG